MPGRKLMYQMNPISVHRVRPRLVEDRERKDCPGVFSNRAHAGRCLADKLRLLIDDDPIVFGVAHGGVLVAREVVRRCGGTLDVLAVGRLLYDRSRDHDGTDCIQDEMGVVGFDGTARLNHGLIEALGVPGDELERLVVGTQAAVQARMERLRGCLELPSLEDRSVVVVDDGLVLGGTMGVILSALRRLGAAQLIVGVPTGHIVGLRNLKDADVVLCLNVRSGTHFSVSEAYRQWTEVGEGEMLLALRAPKPGPRLPQHGVHPASRGASSSLSSRPVANQEATG